MERAVALGDGKIIDASDLPSAIASASPSSESAGSATGGAVSSTDLEDIERATIERVFEQVKGDKALAGKMLGISRATLYRKLKRYNIGAHHEMGSGSAALQ
jgi:transcriptional regulator of acetoin/glycerol metabolism